MRLIALLPLLLLGGVAAAQDTASPAAPPAVPAEVVTPAPETAAESSDAASSVAPPAAGDHGAPAANAAAASQSPVAPPADGGTAPAAPAIQAAPSADAAAAPASEAASPADAAAPAIPAAPTDAAAAPASEADPSADAAPPASAAAPAPAGAETPVAGTETPPSEAAVSPPDASPTAASPAAPPAGAGGDVTSATAAAAGTRPLNIGLLDNAPPFSSAARYGVRVGFDVDLAYGLCARMQRRCRFLPMDRAELTQALRDRRVDAVIASDGRSEYAGAFANFSEPYLSLAARFVVPRASAADLESADATAYGAVLGTPHAQYLQTTYKDQSSVALYSSQEEMWIDLALGRLQGALATAVTARLEFLDTPLGSDFRFASGSLANAKVRANQATIAVRKGDTALLDQLNQALDSYMNSTDYAEALNRHLTGGLATRPSAAGRT